MVVLLICTSTRVKTLSHGLALMLCLTLDSAMHHHSVNGNLNCKLPGILNKKIRHIIKFRLDYITRVIRRL